MKFQLKTFLGFMGITSIFIIFGALLNFQVGSLNPIINQLNEDLEDFDTSEELEKLTFVIEDSRSKLVYGPVIFIVNPDELYQQQYELSSQQIFKTVDKAIKRSDNAIDKKIFENLKETNMKLENTEREVFNLVQENKIEEAKALLVGEEYQSLKESFSLFITKFFNNKQMEANDSFSKLVQVSGAIEKNSLVLKSLTQLILISVASVVIASILLSIFISRSISKPLIKLNTIANDLNKGLFDTKIVIESNDEIGEFSKAFDSVANTMKKNQVLIKKQLVKLEVIDKQKEEFSSMVTHELKTPLTPIRGYCEILKDESFGTLTKDQINYVEKIDSNARLLERLIGDVLDVQKLDMGKMSFNKKSFDMCNFLDRLKQDSSHLMKDKGIEFVVTDSLKTTLKTDQLRLLQILENLIRNSVDFVPSKNGKIEVGVKQENGKMIFRVKDNGVGISKEKQQNIFKKFYQVDTSHTRKHGGTGLGLVVCKGLIEGLGGEIWFESESGKETTFYFSIPIYEEKIIMEIPC